MRTITTPIPSTMASIERRSPVLPVATLLLASAAAVLATVAILTDDIGSIKPVATPAVAAVTGPNASTGAPGDPIIYERDGGACRLRAITTPCP
jgi:hypothetical protein